MKGFGGQLGLLLWKNTLLFRRRVCLSTFEILLPVMFSGLILCFRIFIKPQHNQNATIYKSVSTYGEDYLLDLSNLKDAKLQLGYTPNTTLTKRVIKRMMNKLDTNAIVLPKGFSTENQMLDYYKFQPESLPIALVFKDLPEGATSLPLTINILIRPQDKKYEDWQTSKTFPTFQSDEPRPADSSYSKSGVLTMQTLVTEALVAEWNNRSDMPRFAMALQRMPYPPYIKDPMISVIQNQLRLFLVLSFLLFVIDGTKTIVYEKEQKLKESMKLMGLKLGAYWASWFITCSLYMVVSTAVYTLLFGLSIMEGGPVLALSDASLFYVFLLCYGASIVSFCILISAITQKAMIGAVVSGLLYFLLYIPSEYIVPLYETMTILEKWATCLIFNQAMAFGANIIGLLEGSGEGAQWHNFHKPPSVDDNFSLLNAMIMLLIDSAIYLIFAWYIDNVRPGEFGVPKPYYFCFTKTYWCGSSGSFGSAVYTGENYDETCFERDPVGLQEGITICNLHKTYGKTTVAVKNMSMKMYEGQITVLLGHNGAGKTTTMSMLTGFFPPTSGTAYVNKKDIRTDIDGVRESLGLCPQHDILFDLLTVKEHLTFFAKLKGCPNHRVQEEVNNMIREVGLIAKTNALAKTLSGGQKRKLSVGIALISDSKVVILDEPSSGMDPAARRQAWEVLQRHRAGRTILLTTHFMDEADVLGDRIAIMAEGVVKCCGTSLFLKKLYGAGYHLVIVKTDTCKIDDVTRMIQSSIPAARLENEVKAELTYLLPDNQSAAFPSLFRSLENQKNELGIRNFGVTAATMEEVFLKVGEILSPQTVISKTISTMAHAPTVTSSVKSNQVIDSSFSSVDPIPDTDLQETWPTEVDMASETAIQSASIVSQVQQQNWNRTDEGYVLPPGYTKLTGRALWLSKLRGLITKKAILLCRQRIMTLVQLLLPAALTAVGLTSTLSGSAKKPELPLDFNLHPFGATTIPYAYLSPSTKSVADLYKDQFGSDQSLVNIQPPQSLNDFLIKTVEDIGASRYRRELIVGVEFVKSSTSSVQARSYYNGRPYHAQPITLAYTLNALAKQYTNSKLHINMGLHPFPRKQKEAIDVSSSGIGFLVGLMVSLGMSFLTSSFVFYPIKERVVGAKHMQIISGAGPVVYWFVNFIVDYINYLMSSLLMLLVFYAFKPEAYVEDGRMGILVLVLLMYGWAALPFMYLLQFIFTYAATGLTVCIIFNVLFGLTTMLVVYMLESIPLENLQKNAITMDWMFLGFFPNHCLARCISNIYTNFERTKTCINKLKYATTCLQWSNPCCKDYGKGCDGYCILFTKNYLDWELPGISRYLAFMAIQGFVFLIFTFVIDSRILDRLFYAISLKYHTSESALPEDSDVAEERHRINKTPLSVLTQQDSLLLVSLFRQYQTMVAVDRVCVGIPEQECFGLLGQNGAGKTTIFKMLTGDVMISGGNAYLKGYNIKNNIRQVQANMGYCPQIDALLDQMTVRETLTMYARLRGVPQENIEDCVAYLIGVLLLSAHANKRIDECSGGSKRKLSTAVALTGDPPFILLDEPSSGMDPAARRQLWNVLSDVRASGRTLVLTSHSMEECEALCTKIAIMVNGRFVCLGSTQHLKSKFGQGYTLEAKMSTLEDGSTAPTQPLVAYIKNRFPSAVLFQSQHGYVHMQIPDSNVHLADVFEVMEGATKKQHVENYNVHQTTLEQIFLSFTGIQTSPQTDRKSVLRRLCRCC